MVISYIFPCDFLVISVNRRTDGRCDLKWPTRYSGHHLYDPMHTLQT